MSCASLGQSLHWKAALQTERKASFSTDDMFSRMNSRVDDTRDNFLSNVAVNRQPGETNLTYPGRHLLLISMGKCPKNIAQKSCPISLKLQELLQHEKYNTTITER